MNFNDLFKSIKSSFTIQKVIDIEDFNLHFILEPLTSAEELKILEACSGLEGGTFIVQLKRSSLAYAIKKINDVDFRDDYIEYEDENGKLIKETKYICLTKQMDSMPIALRDSLFEAFSNMQTEVEVMVDKKVKFKRFTVQPMVEDVKAEIIGVPKGFRKIDEPKEEMSGNETERLNQRVKEEADQAEINISNTPNE
jgi:hypothetical protein